MSGDDFFYMGGGVIAGAIVLALGISVFQLDLVTAFILLVVADIVSVFLAQKVT